jgi:hypothetical protein
MHRNSIFLLCQLFCSSLVAQGVDVRGTIADSVTGEKLPFANVVLIATSRGSASNLQGFYLISNVPPGSYQISVSSVGYRSQQKTVVVSIGQPITLNFELAPKAVQMSEVVVTESPRRRLAEVNASVQVMDRQDIHSVPVAAQPDVFRSIEILPGIISTSDVSSRFFVRGGAGDQNLILLDGMKIYNPFHAFGLYSIFDSDLLKSTEVYTGAFPASFGGRLSSVVNMTTRDGATKNLMGRANINFLSGKLQIEGPIMTDFTCLVNVRKSLFSDTFNKLFSNNLPLTFYDAFIKATGHIAGMAGKLDVQTVFSGDDLKSSDPNQPDYTWRTSAVGVAASGLTYDRTYVDAVGYVTRFEARRDPKSSKTSTAASTSVTETTVRANATFYTDTRDQYYFGFECSFPVLDYSLTNNYGMPQSVYSTMLEWSIWSHYQANYDRLQADMGVFVDISSLLVRRGRWEVLQPRLTLSYEVYHNWRAKLAYGRYTQNMVTVNNEDDVIPIFDAWIQVPSDLKPEEAQHFVAGIEGNVLPNLSTSFQAYYKSYGSLVVYNREKIDAYDPDYVNATGQGYGFESLVRYTSPTMDIYGAYSLGWTTITSNGFTYYPRHDRRHSLNVLATVHLLDVFDMAVRWEVGSGFPFSQTMGYYDRLGLTDMFRQPYVNQPGSPYSILGAKDAARLPTYHRMDASATYRFNLRSIAGSAGFHIVNLYDQKNIFYFDRTTGEQFNMLRFFPSATLTLEF